MHPKPYWTGIPDRILESITFAQCQSETRRFALVLCRLMFGFFKSDILITPAELKALGFQPKDTAFLCTELQNIGWFEIEYQAGEDGFIHIKRKLGFTLYNDGMKLHHHELLIDIARKGKSNYEQKRND